LKNANMKLKSEKWGARGTIEGAEKKESSQQSASSFQRSVEARGMEMLRGIEKCKLQIKK